MSNKITQIQKITKALRESLERLGLGTRSSPSMDPYDQLAILAANKLPELLDYVTQLEAIAASAGQAVRNDLRTKYRSPADFALHCMLENAGYLEEPSHD